MELQSGLTQHLEERSRQRFFTTTILTKTARKDIDEELGVPGLELEAGDHAPLYLSVATKQPTHSRLFTCPSSKVQSKDS